MKCFVSMRCEEKDKSEISFEVCDKDSSGAIITHKWSDGNDYCLLHLPDPHKNKKNQFNRIINERIRNQLTDFRGVFFPEQFATTQGLHGVIETEMKFDFATFNGQALFLSEFTQTVYLTNCEFRNGAQFNAAKFWKHLLFYYSILDGYFSFSATEVADGGGIYFNMVRSTNNSKISFGQSPGLGGMITFDAAIIGGSLEFDGTFRSKTLGGLHNGLSIVASSIEFPERIRFSNCELDPLWFMNTDTRKFTFSNVTWVNSVDYPSSPKIDAYRQLAENAENNNRFEESSKFRQMAFETEWFEKKEKISNWFKNLFLESEKLKRRFGGSTKEEDKPIPPTNSFGILRRSGDFFIHGLYRITSFYGESWSWALGVLLSLILVIFPTIYTQISFQTCSKDRPIAASLTICESKDEEIRKNCTCSTNQITFTDAIVQSLTTATLQNVEYRKPLTVWGELWIILEKIFAPLQAALLALAIRRKFMR